MEGARKELRIKRPLEFRKLGNINWHILSKYAPYLAGLLDGEGSFVLRETGRKHLHFSPLISLGMSHEKTVQFAATVFRVGPLGKVVRKPHKDMFTIKITTEKEIRQICEALLSSSITRHKQILLLLKYFSLKESQATLPTAKDVSQSRKIWLEMINVYMKLKKANERPPSPDYNAMREKLLNKIPKDWGIYESELKSPFCSPFLLIPLEYCWTAPMLTPNFLQFLQLRLQGLADYRCPRGFRP